MGVSRTISGAGSVSSIAIMSAVYVPVGTIRMAERECEVGDGVRL